jgi:hypothetical protein
MVGDSGIGRASPSSANSLAEISAAITSTSQAAAFAKNGGAALLATTPETAVVAALRKPRRVDVVIRYSAGRLLIDPRNAMLVGQLITHKGVSW